MRTSRKNEGAPACRPKLQPTVAPVQRYQACLDKNWAANSGGTSHRRHEPLGCSPMIGDTAHAIALRQIALPFFCPIIRCSLMSRNLTCDNRLWLPEQNGCLRWPGELDKNTRHHHPPKAACSTDPLPLLLPD